MKDKLKKRRLNFYKELRQGIVAAGGLCGLEAEFSAT